MIITKEDFINAISEIKPSFGSDIKDDYEEKYEIINYGEKWDLLNDKIKIIADGFVNSSLINFKILLYGEQGSGKTTMSKYIAKLFNYPYVKKIAPSMFVGYSENKKINMIKKIFNDASLSKNSVIIIDDIERLIEYSELGLRYSNLILQTLLIMINEAYNNKLFVICTCKNLNLIKNIELYDIFNETIEIENIDNTNICEIAKYYNVKINQIVSNYNKPIKKCIEQILIKNNNIINL